MGGGGVRREAVSLRMLWSAVAKGCVRGSEREEGREGTERWTELFVA